VAEQQAVPVGDDDTAANGLLHGLLRLKLLQAGLKEGKKPRQTMF
jgi:hypothetical protein